MNIHAGRFLNKLSGRRNSAHTPAQAEISPSELEFIGDMSETQKKELAFVDEPQENVDASVFLYSLENLQPEDIPLLKEKEKKSFARKMEDFIRTVMMTICALVFVVCSVMLVQNLLEKQKADDLYASLSYEFNITAIFADSGASASAVPLPPPSASDDILPDMTQIMLNSQENYPAIDQKIEVKARNQEVEYAKANLNALALKNPDTYGWITIDGTKIDYPIVLGEDNDYYLNHAFDGSPLVVGSVFADFRTNENILRNYNTVFYGHNITNGSMFNHVTKFLNEDVFNSTKIVVYTFDGKFVYEPFAVYQTRYDYQYIRMEFTSGDDFVKFAEEMQSNSKFNKNMTFTGDDRILTLSTCTNGLQTDRYCLQAKLVEIIR